MAIPERFFEPAEYAFPRLRALLKGIEPGLKAGDAPMVLTIGEPRHAMPDFVAKVMAGQALRASRNTPSMKARRDCWDAISGWLQSRYDLEVVRERIMVLNGTREGVVKRGPRPVPRGKARQAARDSGAKSLLSGLCRCRGSRCRRSRSSCPPHRRPATCPTMPGCRPRVLDRTAIAYLCFAPPIRRVQLRIAPICKR